MARMYLDALLKRERGRAADMVFKALDEGVSLADLYLHVFQTSQYEVGRLWQNGTITVGHEHYCTNATQTIMARLYPRLFSGNSGPRRVVAACVRGELHELGLRMVADFFTMHGWDADYLGAATPEEDLVAVLEESPPDVLVVGVTMHHHLPQAEKTIAAVRASETAGKIPVLIGGYTILKTHDLWRKLGADCMAKDAPEAVALAERILSGKAP